MMGSSDHSPLSPACVRALSDKVYDKRKAAAMEIEKLVRDAVASNNPTQIKRVIDLLEEYSLTLNPHVKKGGLIGLAAAAAGLGTQHCHPYLSAITKPILACLHDNNANVRYYAAESLYNVVRVARHHILPLFSDLFLAVTTLITDTDSNVKIGADMLDSTMKGIVKECGDAIDLSSLIPVMRSQLYSTNSTLQTLLVSWLEVLHCIPSLQLVPLLTEILDALLLILSSPHEEVVKATDALLVSLLESCRNNPESVNCMALTPQLVIHAMSPNTTLKNMSLCWLNELLTLGGRSLLPHAAPILAATLRSLAHPSNTKSRKVADEVSQKIMDLLQPTDDVLEPSSGDRGDEEGVNLPALVNELLSYLREDSDHCKFIALHWLHHLLKHFPNKMCGELERLCRDLLPALNDPSDDVVVLVLMLLATIAGAKDSASTSTPQADTALAAAAATTTSTTASSSSDVTFERVLRLLLEAMADSKSLLDNRGSLILRELCVLLNPTEVYVCLSQLLQEDQRPPDLVSSMARIMVTSLITSRELFALRLQLRSLQTKESCEVFSSLFRCWSHNPVSVIQLCLLSQSYEEAAVLVQLLGEAEVTVDFLVEVDKLVQLLESPIFTYLRLDLLKNDRSSNALVETLYGLLMILPQSNSYTTLATRLNNLPPAHHRIRASTGQQSITSTLAKTPAASRQPKEDIDFESLLKGFSEVQQRRRELSRLAVQQSLQQENNIETLIASVKLGAAGE